ncbi:MAG: type II toxin-antitoxin system VapB family antitoxin [Candidatus Limnocylindria bacterium]
MHKTTLMVDDKKIARVRRLLGTKGIRDTIDQALDEVIAVRARRRVIEQLRTMEGLDENMLRNARKEAWR